MRVVPYYDTPWSCGMRTPGATSRCGFGFGGPKGLDSFRSAVTAPIFFPPGLARGRPRPISKGPIVAIRACGRRTKKPRRPAPGWFGRSHALRRRSKVAGHRSNRARGRGITSGDVLDVIRRRGLAGRALSRGPWDRASRVDPGWCSGSSRSSLPGPVATPGAKPLALASSACASCCATYR